jgi:mannose-1-phosphate guanylyltransferase
VQFYEKVKNPPTNLANGAVYVISPELMSIMKYKFRNATDFSLDVLPSLMGKIITYKTKKKFIDIGTPNNYRLANSEF